MKNISSTVRFSFLGSVFLFTILFLNFFSQAQAQTGEQQYLELKGNVYDSQSNNPLIYAELNVNSTNISTITNTEGEFLLKVPNEYQDRMVTVSFLGFITKEVPLSQFKKENTIIYLTPGATQLSEVNLQAFKDAETLVRETLKRKSNNYYNNPVIMTAFYRETIKKRNKNAQLSEAVLEIYKQPVQSGRNDIVSLVKSRKNTNYSRLDTIAVKLQGGPFSTLYTDLIKYPQYIFSYEDLNDYVFSFGTPTQIDNKKVYVVNFEQKPNIFEPLYKGQLFIDSSSLALTSAIFELNVENQRLASAMFVKKKPNKVSVYPTKAAYRVDYRIKDGKWHYGYSNIELAIRVKWKNKLFGTTYTVNSEMAITDWKTNNNGIAKPKDRLKPSAILADEASGFSDPEFWGEYNIIEPEKSIETAIEKISKKVNRLKA